MDIKKIILGLTVVILFSCETEEFKINKLYLKEVIDPSSYTDKYEYNGDQLISYRRYFGERLATDTEFIYQSNQLTTIKSKDDNGANYTIELSFGANGLRERQTSGSTVVDFFYDEEQNLILKRNLYNNPDFFNTETEYEWENGNIIKKNNFYYDNEGIRHFVSSEEFLFDNKRNYTNKNIAFVYIVGFDEIVLSKNNLITNSKNYEYNNIGYPIKYKYSIDNKDYTVLMNYE